MKKTITSMLLAAAALVNAREPTVSNTMSNFSINAPRIMEENTPKSGFSYFRVAAADSYPTQSVKSVQVVPGLGVGYRMAAGQGALDISANYSSSKGLNQTTDSFFWTLPKVTYLYYLNADNAETAYYAGAGLAWGGMETKNSRSFEGVIANATTGMEFFRKAAVRTFAEITVSQATIASSMSVTRPGPSAEFSFGAGF